jgi:hypothetical protein
MLADTAVPMLQTLRPPAPKRAVQAGSSDPQRATSAAANVALMQISMTATTKTAGLLAAGLLALCAASCSSSNEATAPATPTAAGNVTQSGSAGTETEAPGTSAETSAAAGSAASAAPPEVTLDGQRVDAEFQPARCEWGTDEGHRQLEYDAGSGNAGGDLEVEIVMSDPPKLDDFALETGSVDWEATSADRQNAQITVDGDNYRVSSPVTEDDGTRTATLEASFTCAGQ